jgi:hypothetical protein
MVQDSSAGALACDFAFKACDSFTLFIAKVASPGGHLVADALHILAMTGVADILSIG